MVLLQICKNRPLKSSGPIAEVKVGQKTLIERTGFSINTITKALQELEGRRFIRSIDNRKKSGEFGANEYLICNPLDWEPRVTAKNLMYENKLPYFLVPACIVTWHAANWSLAKMTGSEIRLYVCVLWLANFHRSNQFKSTGAELRKVSGLRQATFPKALDGLGSCGLVQVRGDAKDYDLHLCDPFTGEPIHEQTGVDEDDPANYYVKGDKGQAKRLNLNNRDPEQVKNLLRDCLQGAAVTEQSNGDWMIRCPFHSDENPSCSVSPSKNGCFHCFGCDKSGSLTDLFMQLKGIPKSEAIQQMAAMTGTTIEYHEPDENVVARYSYKNAKGKLIKQVLRYPNDENGEKVFRQRQPIKGGDWLWSTAGLPPMLFNLDLLKYAGVACITEGEKDACTVSALNLGGPQQLLMGTTSGGAESWDARLAKELRGKKVVLMPDADEPGQKYAAAVEASLVAEGIDYRVVTFEDVGQKDVTDFLQAGHSEQELARRIGTDWVDVPGEPQVWGDGPNSVNPVIPEDVKI